MRQASSNRKFASLACAVLLAVCGSSVAFVAHAAQFSIDAVKAAYLFRFAQYVEWPAQEAGAPFVFAIAGAENVAVHLERLLPGMPVNGRRAVVRRVSGPQDLAGVHILYVGTKALSRTRALRARAIERPILVVTDDERGLDGGGVINFIEVNRNLRFEISLNAADRSGLKIDTALLSVAAHVERRPQGSINCANGCRVRMASVVRERGR